jgi:hypothetical protein
MGEVVLQRSVRPVLRERELRQSSLVIVTSPASLLAQRLTRAWRYESLMTPRWLLFPILPPA